MVPEPIFRGVGVALLTLFDAEGELLVEATAEHAAGLAMLGVRAIVVAGTTGEAAALALEERDELVAAVREAVPREVPVLAGTGAPTGGEAVQLTRAAAAAGADAALVLSPSGVTDPSGYYQQVADGAGDLPLLAYHFPLASPPGIPRSCCRACPCAGSRTPRATPSGSRSCSSATTAKPSSAPPPCSRSLGPSVRRADFGDGEPGAGALCGGMGRRRGAQRALLETHLATSEAFPRVLKERVAERFGTPTGVRRVLS